MLKLLMNQRKAGEEGEQELKMEEGHVTAAVSEEMDDKAEKETDSLESSETAREGEETKLEESLVAAADTDEAGYAGAEKESDHVDSPETAGKEQGENYRGRMLHNCCHF